MINKIMLEERKLWNDLQQCMDILGMHDPITEAAVARWSVINQLVKNLGL